MTLSVSTSNLISATHYNNVFDSYVELLAGSTASYGEQLYAATTATVGQLASSAHWIALFNDINKCHIHQTGQPIPGIYDLTSVPYWYGQWASDNGYTVGSTKYDLGTVIANTFYLPGGQTATVGGVARYGLYRNPDRSSLAYWTDMAADMYGLTASTVAASQTFADAFYYAIDPDSDDFKRSITAPGPSKTFDDGAAVSSSTVTFSALSILPTSNQTLIKADFVNRMANTATVIVANADSVYAPTQLAPYTGSYVIATVDNWNTGPISTSIEYDWQDVKYLYYFYNLGSYLTTRLAYSGTSSQPGDPAFLEFIDNANAPHSTLYSPYTKSDWLAGTKTLTYSTATTGGTFTGTVAYTKTGSKIYVTATITPPVGLGSISLDALASGTVVRSVGAIVAPMPKITDFSKLLTASPSSLTFNITAGTPSGAQTVTLDNQGDEAVTVQSITVSSNGAQAYVVNSVATNQFGVTSVDPILYPFSVNQVDTRQVSVFYNEPADRREGFGTFNNALIVRSDSNFGDIRIPVTVTVNPATPQATLRAIDYSLTYTYSTWASEYGFNAAYSLTGQAIAQKFYLPNTDFGIVAGVQRFALYRKPDRAGLAFWTQRAYELGVENNLDQLTPYFFGSIDPVGVDYVRSRTSSKTFDEGFGYGDFYDGISLNNTVDSSATKSINHRLEVLNGTLISYTSSVSAFSYNGTPDSGLSSLFSVRNTPTGPTVMFNPNQFLYTGTFSLTLTANVQSKNYAGVDVPLTTSTEVSFLLDSIVDGNLVQWVSGYDEYNSVVGISYDNIFGKRYLTVGIGVGADGSPELSGANYADTYVNINQLGKAGDLEYDQLGSGKIAVYKAATAPAWGSFMNTYAVWVMSDNVARPAGKTITREFTFAAPSAGSYTVYGAVDDLANIYIDNALVLTPSGFTAPSSAVVSLTAGVHTIKLEFSNYRELGEVATNPGGIAVRIVGDPGEVWSTLVPVRATSPYAYWREVYRIEIPRSSGVYYLNDAARVKETWPVDFGGSNTLETLTNSRTYNAYFGAGTSARSIMRVEADASGNLSFYFSPLVLLTGLDINDRTLSSLLHAPYYGSSSPVRKKNIGSVAADGTTDKLVGMTPTAVRTIRDRAPGYTSIEVQSTVYNNNVLGEQSYVKINGETVVTNVSRGHTLVVINPYNYAVETVSTYDTWGLNSSVQLTSALNNVPDGKIIAIISYDATQLDQATRNVLINRYGSSLTTSVWTADRIAHAFIGRANVNSFGRRERVSNSTDLGRNYTYWPNGPTDVENFTNIYIPPPIIYTPPLIVQETPDVNTFIGGWEGQPALGPTQSITQDQTVNQIFGFETGPADFGITQDQTVNQVFGFETNPADFGITQDQTVNSIFGFDSTPADFGVQTTTQDQTTNSIFGFDANPADFGQQVQDQTINQVFGFESTSECFSPDTLITMADGSKKRIVDVVQGDLVQGVNGPNRVLKLLEFVAGTNKLHGFNGKAPFVTSCHPIKTTKGWAAFDPDYLEKNWPIDWDILCKENQGPVERIDDQSQIAFWKDGQMVFEQIADHIDLEVETDYKVYNLSLDNDHTFIANDVVVHNKECFTAGTLINMADGSLKPIDKIEIGDLVTDALTGVANKVIGVKVTEYQPGRRIFSTTKGVKPFITEQHAFYNENNELCAMSEECEYLAPWLGPIKIVDVPEIEVVKEPTTVYNLMFETGNSHYANGLPVSNMVGHGSLYVLLMKGLISKDEYEGYIYHLENTVGVNKLTQEQKATVFNAVSKMTKYILENDNIRSRLLAKTLAWAVKNRLKLYPYLEAYLKSSFRERVVKKIIKKFK